MKFLFDPALVLYLPLFELDGASMVSKDAYGHLCTVTGASRQINGRYFDGGDDFISLPVNSPLITPKQGTLVVWFRGDNPYRSLFACSDKDTTAVNEGKLELNALRFVQWRTDISGGVTQEVRTANNIYAPDNWVCAIVASNGIKTEIDTDGVNRPLTAASGTNNGDWIGDVNNIDNVTLGSLRRPGPDYWSGIMGEVILFNSYKSFQERQAIYQTTKWRYQ